MHNPLKGEYGQGCLKWYKLSLKCVNSDVFKHLAFVSCRCKFFKTEKFNQWLGLLHRYSNISLNHDFSFDSFTCQSFIFPRALPQSSLWNDGFSLLDFCLMFIHPPTSVSFITASDFRNWFSWFWLL